MRHVASILLVIAALGACGRAPASSSIDAAPPTVDSTAPPTTLPSTTAASTTAPPATTIGTTTTAPCQAPTSTDTVSVDFPNLLSSLIGKEIRTGTHPCVERVVIELQGEGTLPGYRVQYVDDPVKLSPSDLEVDIAGDATLVVSVGVWMTTMEGDGYNGPDQIEPTNVAAIKELRLIENFEGMHQWAIGLDRVRPFSVTTLADPPQIVVDIAVEAVDRIPDSR